MNRRLRLFVIAGMAWMASIMSSAAYAAGGAWGIGVVLGEPTGFTGKHWLSTHSAIDAGLAFSFNSFFLIYADYLWHFPHGFASAKSERFIQELSPYIGGGAIMLFSTNSGRLDGKFFTAGGSSVGFGMRIPLGIEWRPSHPPLGIFVEMVPGMGLVPSTFAFLEGGAGVRWYF